MIQYLSGCTLAQLRTDLCSACHVQLLQACTVTLHSHSNVPQNEPLGLINDKLLPAHTSSSSVPTHISLPRFVQRIQQKRVLQYTVFQQICFMCKVPCIQRVQQQYGGTSSLVLSHLGHPLSWAPHRNMRVRNSTGSQNWWVLCIGYVLIWTQLSHLQLHDSPSGSCETHTGISSKMAGRQWQAADRILSVQNSDMSEQLKQLLQAECTD